MESIGVNTWIQLCCETAGLCYLGFCYVIKTLLKKHAFYLHKVSYTKVFFFLSLHKSSLKLLIKLMISKLVYSTLIHVKNRFFVLSSLLPKLFLNHSFIYQIDLRTIFFCFLILFSIILLYLITFVFNLVKRGSHLR